MAIQYIAYISREFTFNYAHRLLTLGGNSNNIHGHIGKIKFKFEIITSNKDREFFISRIIKKIWEQKFKPVLDYSLILNKEDELLKRLEGMNLKIIKIEGEPTINNISLLVMDRYSKNIIKINKLLPPEVKLKCIIITDVYNMFMVSIENS